MTDNSIFKKFYSKEDFLDRRSISKEECIDVIIPILNINELFEKNIISIYREIPINKLIIGNAGSSDDSIEILNKFPRVVIIDQHDRKTLGYCLTELISNVETEWFVYLHSDVYLSENWYDKMKFYQNRYDWFESDSRITTLVEIDPQIELVTRAYSGGQMGKTKSFEKIIKKVDDDYLYRNEDIVFHELILENGFKYGRVIDTYFYHQIMKKRGDKVLELNKVHIERKINRLWEIDTLTKQVKGIIKYTKPKPYLIIAVNKPLNMLKKYNTLDIKKFKSWVRETNIEWLKYLQLKQSVFQKFVKLIGKILSKLPF